MKNGQNLTQKIWCYRLTKIGVFGFLISWIFGKKQRNKKQSWFLVNSRFFYFTFHANLMSDGKEKRLKFLFITPLILLIDTSIILFRWTVQLITTQKFFVTKTAKLCSIILVSKIIKFYRYTENEKSNT